MTATQLVGVYNARGGLAGELAYLRGKITRTTHCALCDITHGLNPLGRRAWKAAASCLPLPVSTVHLNEMDGRTAAVMARTRAPAIVLLSPEGDSELVSAAELDSCNKDPRALQDLITDKLAQLP